MLQRLFVQQDLLQGQDGVADYKADFQIGLKVEMNFGQTTAIPSVGDLVPKMPESIRFRNYSYSNLPR